MTGVKALCISFNMTQESKAILQIIADYQTTTECHYCMLFITCDIDVTDAIVFTTYTFCSFH